MTAQDYWTLQKQYEEVRETYCLRFDQNLENHVLFDDEETRLSDQLGELRAKLFELACCLA